MEKNHRILTYFKPGEDDSLYRWALSTGRPNQSYFGREAYKCLRFAHQQWGDDWWNEIHKAAFLAKEVKVLLGNDDNLREAAAALAFMREKYGPNWQEEMVK